jgi:hypothetical protein
MLMLLVVFWANIFEAFQVKLKANSKNKEKEEEEEKTKGKKTNL